MSNKFVKSILQMWSIIENFFSQLTRMTRDLLIVSTIEINCERVFNIANALYDHRRSYNFIIFNVIMMIRCHNQKKNEMNEKLTTTKNLIMKQLQKEMKTRVKKFQIAFELKYINDIDKKQSNVVSSFASTSSKSFFVSSKFSTIKKKRFFSFSMFSSQKSTTKRTSICRKQRRLSSWLLTWWRNNVDNQLKERFVL